MRKGYLLIISLNVLENRYAHYLDKTYVNSKYTLVHISKNIAGMRQSFLLDKFMNVTSLDNKYVLTLGKWLYHLFRLFG